MEQSAAREEPRPSHEEVVINVRDLISQLLGFSFDEVKPNSRLIENLHVDSYDMVELVMAFEDAFGFEGDDDDWDKILRTATVEQVANYIETQVP